MQNNKINVRAQTFTGEDLYSTVNYDVEFWNQAMAIMFFKYKDQEWALPKDKRSISRITFEFSHG